MKLFRDSSACVAWLECVLDCDTDAATSAYDALYDADQVSGSRDGVILRLNADQVRERFDEFEEV